MSRKAVMSFGWDAKVVVSAEVALKIVNLLDQDAQKVKEGYVTGGTGRVYVLLEDDPVSDVSFIKDGQLYTQEEYDATEVDNGDA